MSSSGKCKIPIKEILSATNGFAEENIIGAGGFGKVYRGQSKQYGLLAIKRLIIGLVDQGDHEYGMEIELLSKYKHENLVSLVGFCGEGGERILAYKYEANGSLDKVLHRKDLSWTRRLQICRDAARGLRYLHNESGSEHGVIHRDIKSSNILLDEKWKAKISDFGLSKITLTKSPNSFMFTAVCGTYGYLDPEYQQDGTLTQKSDVYSFGIVLFEVLLGKLVSPFPNFVHDCYFNLEMAKKHYQNRTLDTMIDPDLKNQMNSDSFSTFSSIAYECLKKHRKDRPAMSSVVEELEKALAYQQASWFLYDVYISCRLEFFGTYGFDKLCGVLEREGLSIYKANIRGSRKESDLLSAIKRSRSFIIIFSKNFAANSWNLDEVAEIVKCMKERGGVVVSVFSDDVYPSEVRKQKGYFGQAMSKYDTHPRMVEWKNALVEVTNVPGLEESDFRNYIDLGKEAAARIKGPSPQLTSTQPSIKTVVERLDFWFRGSEIR